MVDMSLVPEIQGLVNDAGFFDYSPTQTVQSTYVDYLDPSKKVQEQLEKIEDSYLVTFSGKEISSRGTRPPLPRWRR